MDRKMVHIYPLIGAITYLVSLFFLCLLLTNLTEHNIFSTDQAFYTNYPSLYHLFLESEPCNNDTD